VISFEVLFRYYPGGTKVNHKMFLSVYPDISMTFQVRVQSNTASAIFVVGNKFTSKKWGVVVWTGFKWLKLSFS